MLPTEAKARKDVPLFSGLIRYFPRALAAVAAVSKVGNDQHNPGQPLHWDRAKSTDEHDALTRHLFEAGAIDSDGVRHSAKVAWRALAALEKELEAADSLLTTVGEKTCVAALNPVTRPENWERRRKFPHGRRLYNRGVSDAGVERRSGEDRRKS